ncbi:molybdopterin cofactor-binding domain-containing protein [Motiliproteus sp. MSK22-1]|uniref:xanthine dehydrogenase family protein molybdopterin-binding subunit n=1 Tax=Motiliproteus sp. MSK22-1 TaxID=1897630 RepID=UPI0009759A03|nr:molybdopterin cofactor-binding domain-containing protein [Motiliproteus sp. MSK22-1]OMH26622.1 hypothetical protein BGP75_23280 [Motiliproteus sp. MSK22-1]
MVEQLTSTSASEGAKQLSRRAFLKASAIITGGLQLALMMPSIAQAEKSEDAFTSGAYIRITPNNQVFLTIGQSEMGQGSLTGLAQLIAEELDADWATVIVERGEVHSAFFRPNAPIQVTGGSGSIRSFYMVLRQTGAAARQMMLLAAARHWNLPIGNLNTKDGMVIAPGDQRLSYGDLVSDAGALKVPDLLSVPLKDESEFRLIGKPMKRLDIQEKVTGEAPFGMDIQLPGMLTAVILHPPAFGAKLLAFDSTAADKAPGIKAIFPVSEGLAIVADSYWHAVTARKSVAVSWSDDKPAFDNDVQNKKMMELALQQPGLVALERGDQRGIFSANHVSAQYDVPHLAHACMEPLNCTIQLRSDSAEVWTGTQFQTSAQQTVASVTGLAPESIAIHTQYLGGGFGRRSAQDFIRLAAEVAQKFDVPVKTVYSREDDMKAGYYRPAACCQMAADLDHNGSLVAFQAKLAVPSLVKHTGLKFLMLPGGVDSTAVEGLDDHSFPYQVANGRVEWVEHDPGVPVWFWRSVGASQNFFFLETFVDQLAAKSRRDPLEFRLAHLEEKPRHRRVLEAVASAARWGTPDAPGVARGIAVAESFGSVCAQVVEVELQDGFPVVRKVVSALDAGRVINPAMVEKQVHGSVLYALSALYSGRISFEKGQVVEDNFWTYEPVRIDRSPVMETLILPSTAPPGGVGEPATPPLAPAACNALFALTGKLVTSLPLKGQSFKLRHSI